MMPSILLDNDGLAALLAEAGKGAATVAELVEHVAAPGDTVRRSIGWLAKNDLIRLKVPAGKADAKPAGRPAAKAGARAAGKATAKAPR